MNFRILTHELPQLLRETSSRQYLLHCAWISLRKRLPFFAVGIFSIVIFGYLFKLPLSILFFSSIIVCVGLFFHTIISSFLRHLYDTEIYDISSKHISKHIDE